LHDTALLQWGLVLLAFVPCGRAFAIDAWIGRRRYVAPAGPAELLEGAAWPMRTVHVLLVLAYFSAGATKVLRDPLAWFSGSTMQYYVAFHALRSGTSAGLWLMRQPQLLAVVATLVALFEVTFVLTLWWRARAWIWALGAITVHAAAFAFMGIAFPSFPVLCLAVLPVWDRRRRVAPAALAHEPAPAVAGSTARRTAARAARAARADGALRGST
jgi:hypothetical protein